MRNTCLSRGELRSRSRDFRPDFTDYESGTRILGGRSTLPHSTTAFIRSPTVHACGPAVVIAPPIRDVVGTVSKRLTPPSTIGDRPARPTPSRRSPGGQPRDFRCPWAKSCRPPDNPKSWERLICASRRRPGACQTGAALATQTVRADRVPRNHSDRRVAVCRRTQRLAVLHGLVRSPCGRRERLSPRGQWRRRRCQ